MLDSRARRLLAAPLGRIAAAIDRPWVTPDRLTVAGLAVGLASALAAAGAWWWLALVLWLLSRILDGLDGTLARRRRARESTGGRTSGGSSEAGGFLDIVCDFVVYGCTVFGVAVGASTEFGSPWWPFALVLVAYYVNGAAFLAFSSIAERTGRRIDDGRSLSFLGKLAEGTETIIVHSVWLILPMIAWHIAAVWAVFVAASAAQRIVVGYRALR
ncbi:CDP-alcohol phosphatidyltransferase family protein [Marisediminicola senii]|uniref:CDP-alcohol phosphatidyltransferase family protein n=1 Tax=Marisediminicola senii TaxID=2711233 RepID=UPI0013ECB2ED|nr:CDP-alcohol phosphatidyltransferase family protein [Marisediminicola senii]